MNFRSLSVLPSDDALPPFILLHPLTGSNSLQELVRGWVRQSFALSTYVNRLDIPEQDFSEEMEGCGPLTDLRSSVEDLLAETIKQCDQIRRQFLQFEELVSVDREEYLEKFLAGAVHRRVKEGTEENVDGPQYHRLFAFSHLFSTLFLPPFFEYRVVSV